MYTVYLKMRKKNNHKPTTTDILARALLKKINMVTSTSSCLSPQLIKTLSTSSCLSIPIVVVEKANTRFTRLAEAYVWLLFILLVAQRLDRVGRRS